MFTELTYKVGTKNHRQVFNQIGYSDDDDDGVMMSSTKKLMKGILLRKGKVITDEVLHHCLKIRKHIILKILTERLNNKMLIKVVR